MKRVLALLLVTLLAAAACGGGSSGAGSGGSSGGESAADLLKASQQALKDAKSASFELTVSLKLDGNLQGAGPGAAFLQGPLSLSLKGQAGKADGNGAGKFDVHFALNFTGGSFSGEALSPDGKTAYIQMPTLLGPGWKSIDISKETGSSGSTRSSNKSLDQLKALGLDPSQWLKNLEVSTSGSTDTISADLDIARIITDASALSNSPIKPKDRKQLDELVSGIKTAHASESFDHSTHLPSALSAEFAVDIPADMQKDASGLTGLDLKVDASFSDWNSDFTVTAPSGATPLDSGGLFGGLSQAA
ncbi:MAG TPA: hypothetical protein VLB81_03355 [Gaiellales bacterium]|nr:hypothetical protein [Gaiellales bacterium]